MGLKNLPGPSETREVTLAAKPANKPTTKTTAVRKAAAKPAAPAAKKTVAVKKTAPKPAAPAAKKAVAVKKAATVKKAAAAKSMVKVPRQRAAGTKAASPVALRVVAAPQPVVRQPELLTTVRDGDGRALSFSERLAEAMHGRLAHGGPVCHRCRINSSRLATVASAASPIAI